MALKTKSIKKINKPKADFLEKINKSNNPLAKLTKEKREKTKCYHQE